MLIRATRIYLLALFTAVACLSVFAFGMSFAALILPNDAPELYAKRLFLATFAAAVLVLPLARDRNIWVHEVKLCPKPLRIALPIGFFYGLLGPAYAMFTGRLGAGITAFSAEFALGLVCILYAVIWAHSCAPAELPGKLGISFVWISICVAGYLADRSGYLPHVQAIHSPADLDPR